MCIAIHLEPSISLPEDLLKRCSTCHSDGMGFCFVDRKGLQLYKTMEDFEEFYGKLLESQKCCPESNFLLHFRTASAGKKTLENCHPHLSSNGRFALVHNGTISSFRNDKVDESDTVLFLQTILDSVSDADPCLENEGIQFLVESYLSYNKVALLDDSNRVTVFKRSGWESDKEYPGALFSNKTYEGYKYVVKNENKDAQSFFHGFSGEWKEADSHRRGLRPGDNPVRGTNTKHYRPDICEICEEIILGEFHYGSGRISAAHKWRRIRMDAFCARIPEYLRIPKSARRSDVQCKMLGSKWLCTSCNRGFHDLGKTTKREELIGAIQVGPLPSGPVLIGDAEEWALCPHCKVFSDCKTDPPAQSCPSCGYECRYWADALWLECVGTCAECGIKAASSGQEVPIITDAEYAVQP